MVGEGGEEQRRGLEKGSFTLASMELGMRPSLGRAPQLPDLVAIMVGTHSDLEVSPRVPCIV